jgi:hypothetical protein
MDRQYNGPQKRTTSKTMVQKNTTQKMNNWATRAPLNIMVDIRRPGRVRCSYCTSGTHRLKWFLKKWHNCFVWINHKLKTVWIKVTVSTILSDFLNWNFSPKLEQMWVKIHLKQPKTPKSGIHEIFGGNRVRKLFVSGLL